MRYTVKTLHEIAVPAVGLKYNLVDITQWLEDCGIHYQLTYNRQDEKLGFSKIIEYVFTLRSEGDAIAFKMKWA